MTLDKPEEPTIIEPQGTHTRTAIMLHGRGSSGNEFSSELFETRASSGETLRELLPGYRWVFPCAAERESVTFKEKMNQWYDIESLTNPEARSEKQIEGIKESIEQLREIVAREAALSPTGDILLGGISQGFTIALLAVLIGLPHVSALVGFSSWLPFQSVVVRNITQVPSTAQSHADLKSDVSQTLSQLLGLSLLDTTNTKLPPVFLGHNVDDAVVDIDLGVTIRDVLLKLGYDVTWKTSPTGGHWINEPSGMNTLMSFLWRHGLVPPKS